LNPIGWLFAVAADSKNNEESQTSDFPIVGIGASAGGLETFLKLLGYLPTESGMALILVQHLDPKHPSLLTEILARTTKIPVIEVGDLVKVLPNRIYVMPANRDMILLDGVLRVETRKETYGNPVTIDLFFNSLAKDAKHRAIGIILSGTGSDGAHGITEIKAEGGITMAQELASAKFAEMPQNAIATHCIDFVLSPEGIAKELLRISKHPFLDDQSLRKSSDISDLLNILRAVQSATGVDFKSYKRNTIVRRVSRRMLLGRKESFKEYLELLKSDASEVQALYRDFLIGVTSFFRDPDTFEVLRTKIFPALIKDRDQNSTIRIWVAGCATGEEVYSLAMCLTDFLDHEKARFPIQIFGTDISDQAIDQARSGLYRESSIATVPPDHLKRFFTKADNGYQISKTIRDVCIFARQNVATDPPFSAIDLISCRNVLIYLEPPLQKRVISLFHYALRSTGYLMLGNAESAGTYAELFSQIGPNQKVYSKKLGSERVRFDFSRGHSGLKRTSGGRTDIDANDEVHVPNEESELDKDSDKAILANRAPAGVIVNEHFEIVRMRGQTGRFLEAPPGHLTNDILRMTRSGLRGELSKAIHTASRENVVVKKHNLRIKENQGFIDADFEVIPFTSGTKKIRYFAVIFSELPTSRKRSKHISQLDDSRVALLEKELTDTQDYLQSLVDKERSASSDLRVVNEEILSSNEEIQSSNEELETAKEELQSTNEELATVNDELNHRNRSLSELNSDLNNLLGTVHIPVIMLSRDLVIRRYSALAETIVNLTPGDIGRNIRDFKPKMNIPDLVEIVTHVIENVAEHSQEIQDEQGRWYSLRIRPYQTIEKKIDGAIIALIDIGTLKNMRDYAEAIVRTVRESLLVLDCNLRVKSANPYFYEKFSLSPDRVEQKLVYELNNGEWDSPEFRILLNDILVKDSHFRDFEMTHSPSGKNPRTFLLNASRLRDGSKDGDFILLAIEDITERTMAVDELTETAEALSRANLELEQFAFVASHDLQEPLRMVSSYMQLLSKKYHGKLDADADEIINIAVDGAKRMQQLVRDLLNFSQVGKGELKYEPTDTAAVLSVTLFNLKTLIEETQSKITMGQLPVVQTDGVLLGEIFQNLISNAIKFRNGKPPEVHISAKQNADNWEFSIKDNGIGIEQQYANRIFLIFQRLHSKEQYAGTGIGLAMCKKIVERYGGRIWVHSVLGEGSTFSFTLPQGNGSNHQKNAKPASRKY
jgi:two-component system, chemotaxis family, CheB/CheR fusion protein